jgi:hypothetical protein
MKNKKYIKVLPTHLELIKSVPIEFRGVLSYATLVYIFETEKIDLPAECLETWSAIEKKVERAKKSQIHGKKGGYTLHKREGIGSINTLKGANESPVNTENVGILATPSPARVSSTTISNINNNINTLDTIIKREKTEEKKEKTIKVINKNKAPEFLPPTIEELTAFFTVNGYTAEAAAKCWHYYTDGDWVDSQGRPVQNWKRKVRFNWFKPEYLQVKGSVYTRSQYRPA